jgi:hypothetical protein
VPLSMMHFEPDLELDRDKNSRSVTRSWSTLVRVWHRPSVSNGVMAPQSSPHAAQARSRQPTLQGRTSLAYRLEVVIIEHRLGRRIPLAPAQDRLTIPTCAVLVSCHGRHLEYLNVFVQLTKSATKG